MTISGPAGNLGGYELVLGKFPISRESLSATIVADLEKYGTLIGPKAKASTSSDTDYTPADGLVKLLDPMISEIPFAFHTKDEKHPWVKVVFPTRVRLSAMSIVNRRELQERAAGLVLQRLDQAGEWETIWTSDQPREVWNVDLTALANDQREGTEFRFYITSDEVTALHLANISLWSTELPAPAPTPAEPKPKKKL